MVFGLVCLPGVTGLRQAQQACWHDWCRELADHDKPFYVICLLALIFYYASDECVFFFLLVMFQIELEESQDWSKDLKLLYVNFIVPLVLSFVINIS